MTIRRKRALPMAGALITWAALSAMPVAAADLPMYKAVPPAAPVFSWTGFYVGVNAGYGWGTTTWSDLVSPIGNIVGDFVQHNTTGGLAGAQWGYDRQISNWVLGFASDLDWSGIRGSSICFGSDGSIQATCGTKLPWISTSTVRAGLAMGHFLPYVKGGVALTRDEFTAVNLTSADPAHQGAANYLPTNSYRLGWTVGGGMEYAFDRSWSAFAEYDYIDFGNNQEGFTPSVNNVLTTNFSANIRQNISTVKVGVNFKYGDILLH
jgi:outer membrane immunogenic protein